MPHLLLSFLTRLVKMTVIFTFPYPFQGQNKRKQERFRLAFRRSFLHRMWTGIWLWAAQGQSLDIKGSLPRAQFAHLPNGANPVSTCEN